MSKNFNTVTSGSPEWYTPLSLIQSLGEFDLDPCFDVDGGRPWDTAKRHLSKVDDGLKAVWEGRAFVNPPYGRETGKWMRRCAEHGNCIALIYARPDTAYWHDVIFPTATGLFFFRNRIRFINGKTLEAGDVGNGSSVLVCWGENNYQAALNSGQKGYGVRLR
jgi:hypothetical protein